MKPQYRKAMEDERHRKNGIRKWRNELERFGSEVIPLIPDGLVEDVIATRQEKQNFAATSGTNSALAQKLMHSVSVRVGYSPEQLLQDKLSQQGRFRSTLPVLGLDTNPGDEQSSLTARMLVKKFPVKEVK